MGVQRRAGVWALREREKIRRGIGWGVEKEKKRSVKRERGSLKDEKMKEAEWARGRKGMRETVVGEILYTCHFLPGSTIPGGKVLMGGVPVSLSAQKKVLTGSRWNGEGLEELFPRFTLLSEDFATASIFYLLLLSVLIFIFLFIPFTLASLLTCNGVSVKPTIFFVLRFFKPLCFVEHL